MTRTQQNRLSKAKRKLYMKARLQYIKRELEEIEFGVKSLMGMFEPVREPNAPFH